MIHHLADLTRKAFRKPTVIWLVFGCFGCLQSNDRVDITAIKGFEIDNTHIADSARIDSIIESMEIIPLMEKKGNYIGEINKLYIYKDKIIIFDRVVSKKALVFDHKGQFIKNMTAHGEGPSEVLQINDCWMNQDGSIDIYDFSLKKIIHLPYPDYNFESYQKGGTGIYHNLIRIPGKGEFYGYSQYNSGNLPGNSGIYYQLERLDKFLEPQEGLLDYNSAIRGLSSLSFSSSFAIYQDTIRFGRPYDPTIYSLDSNGISKKNSFTYKKYGLSFQVFTEIMANYVRKSNNDTFQDYEVLQDYAYPYGPIAETNRFIFLTSVSQKSSFLSIISKQKPSLQLNAKFFFELDHYGLKIPQNLFGVDNNTIIGVINTLELKHYLMKDSKLNSFDGDGFNGYLLVKIKFK